jgi:hypothetical protein
MIKKLNEEIESYTICLYAEFCQAYKPIGSGILIYLFLISALHVFDREEEQLKIENDHDEDGIPHDDFDSVYAKKIVNDGYKYFLINEKMSGLVFTTEYEHGEAPFNDDTEYCFCYLNNEMIRHLHEAGKKFFNITNAPIDTFENMRAIISGFPKYAQKDDVEKFRSFECTIKDDDHINENLLQATFSNNDAFNLEQGKSIKIPRVDGIKGMSGGGLWLYKDKNVIPVGIILKQDPNNDYVEGYRLDKIREDIRKKLNK